MTKDSLFFVEQQTSIRSMVVVCGPAASGGADAFWLRGACVVAAARGADPVGAAVLAEMNDGREQCLAVVNSCCEAAQPRSWTVSAIGSRLGVALCGHLATRDGLLRYGGRRTMAWRALLEDGL